MARKSSSSSACAICDNPNLASICAGCVNYRLNDHNGLLKSLKATRDPLYTKLSGLLEAKKKAAVQHNWRVLQNEKLAKLKGRLICLEKERSQGKKNLEKKTKDLKVKYEQLESAFATLENNRGELLEKHYRNLIYTQSLGLMAITSDLLHKQSLVMKQICKLFPMRRVNSDGEKKDGSNGIYDQICSASLPKGLDPHPVPSDELAASLGYMVQLLNLVIPTLAAPALHNSGFAGSCSRIWQRDSYWDARPSSQSKEYPLFLPHPNFCSSGDENSWSDRSSSNFGVASVESERKSYLEAAGTSSFNYSTSSHSVEARKDLQKGISLLKKSVACITAYSYNSLFLDVPSEASTFESFAKLLATLSSSREVRSVFSLKMACSRPGKQDQRLIKSAWNINSRVPSSSLMESTHNTTLPSTRGNRLTNSTASFLYTAEVAESGKTESLAEGWDMVEHPSIPSPPSQVEDIEHWTHAMFIDATKK